jgi:hypothetical protein
MLFLAKKSNKKGIPIDFNGDSTFGSLSLFTKFGPIKMKKKKVIKNLN